MTCSWTKRNPAMDPDLMPPDELKARSHIVVGADEPRTEAGQIWHEQWHEQQGTECGPAGCGFLGRILGIEEEMAEELRERRLHDLGKQIWARVIKIEAYLVAPKALGALVGDFEDLRKAEQIALWADLQTLFRGGVFPDDL